MSYYAAKEDYEHGRAPRGVLGITKIEAIAIAASGRIHMSVANSGTFRTYYVKAESFEDANLWLEALRGEQERLARLRFPTLEDRERTVIMSLSMEGAGLVSVECKGCATVKSLKEQLTEKFDWVAAKLPSLEADKIRVVSSESGSTDEIWEEGQELCDTSFWGSVKSRAYTEFEVISIDRAEEFYKVSNAYKSVKRDILDLVGKPTPKGAEAEAALQFFSRHAAQEGCVNFFAEKSSLGCDELRQEGIGSVTCKCYIPDVEAPLSICVPVNEKIDKLLEQIHTALPQQNESSLTDFSLKVHGKSEFLHVDGSASIGDYKFVHVAAFSGGEVDLVLHHNSCDEERDCLEHQALCALGGDAPRNTDTVAKRSEEDSIVLWDLKTKFKINILEYVQTQSTESTKSAEPESGHGHEGKAKTSKLEKLLSRGPSGVKMYVTASVCFGGEILANLQMQTQATPWSSNARWAESLEFPIAMCDLPREARACFTVWATDYCDAITAPVGWVSLMLMDFLGFLRDGVVPLKLWPNDAANPIATCIDNVSGNHPGVLFIELQEFAVPVRFPISSPDEDAVEVCRQERCASAWSLTEHDECPNSIPENLIEEVEHIVNADPLVTPNKEQRELLWKYRHALVNFAAALPKYLVSVPWEHRENIWETHKLLKAWMPPEPTRALELLGSKFNDTEVRSYALECIRNIEDQELEEYVLQLVQVIKCEPYHISGIADFLLEKALSNVRIGHQFFWHLKAEMHVPSISERYGILLEQYLKHCGPFRHVLLRENDAMEAYLEVANAIKTVKGSDEKLTVLRGMLRETRLPSAYGLPLDPVAKVASPRIEKCKFMDSKKLPLWLVLDNADKGADPVYIIFKAGDDLRQDLLTLQMLRIMDNIWKSQELDLRLNAYGVVATGDEIGMIEVVMNSNTMSNISKDAGGSAAAFRDDPIANWLHENNPDPEDYDRAVENFIYSCAGYCVATCVLGIGDRHNDNVMLQKSGNMFHIDFGHFLGNFKEKFGIKRERARFVLTPDFAYVMGGEKKEKGEGFKQFEDICVKAFLILREHAVLFINLFSLMLYAGIPELRRPEDISYLKDQFLMHMSAEDAGKTFRSWIYESLYCKTTQINNAIHIMAH